MKNWAFLLTVCICAHVSASDQPYLTVMGRVKMSEGIGRLAADVINALKDDVPINYISNWENDNFEGVPEDVRQILMRKGNTFGKVILYKDVLSEFNWDIYKKIALPKSSDQIRIAYSMLECSRIPTDWVNILHSYFDAVAVPDPFLVKVYQDSGVQLPIFVVPLGLIMKDFFDQPLKCYRNSPFVFANLGWGAHRKNQVMLIRAFAKAFGNNPACILRINCKNYDPVEKDNILQEIKSLGLNNVKFSEHCFNRSAYIKYFQEVDCYVTLSKGEGFSIQPREAMALGIPTIVTDNTAQHTICESGLVRCVPSHILEPAYYHNLAMIPSAYVFNCNVDDAAQALIDVYNNYEAYLQLGQAAREWAHQYEFSQVKKLYLGLVKPKKVVLGSENKVTEECLFTDSPELYEKYLKIQEG